ncbi:sulfurtransferase-like selenium metabolism protein YedF [Enterococcus dongliensis]|uniref:Sulfurtransferase-like selenium metabolism protein YedF n=1 Tax=Enterococcus dongliensis TaxID=2559925 RepID=A0AAW8TMG3_9ENTE|nr:sulfurtransferase-like selenium metabolism protein YedF [Enterococcus dongliensis]MDT2597254.1 sulfurtransferase-like selenium metabolism protein YedF [Enterococcus dongliensis]MDT2603992.1 sulfurtransferase-like selenium metabolism protein YedF [Enterococcus dongliensis]MDT2634888.1 sulfurtransferase-like selenium metabolism protein YedF [Enterococcus dongliensis]MDT2638033.1 sulfurtransferase-like selenium metabolism protein YedF [Enterococcus dongliensis]MDT2638680.1 sulfurtransferase-li
MFKIDALGKACPLPVIETKKALREHKVVQTVVDNEIATQNLKKMAEQLGHLYQMNQDAPSHYTVVISKGNTELTTEAPQVAEPVETVDDYIVVVDTNVMGRGSDELGKNLLKGFIYSVAEQDVLPKKIIFYNGGVHSVAEGSDSLEDLKNMAEQGVEIYACGACLNFYELTAAVGEVTNMYRIVEMMRQAPKIVKP